MLLATGALLSASAAYCQQVGVTRDLPDFYTPGATVTVTLTVNVDEANQPAGFILSETLPDNWTISSSTPTYKKTETAGSRTTYKWLFYGSDVRDRTVTYTASVPSTAAGLLLFGGTVAYFDPAGSYVENAVGGDFSINTETPSALLVTPDSLVFGPFDTDKVLTITNTGGSVLSWSASVPPSDTWLSLSATSGVLGAGASASVTVSVSRGSKPSGTYLSSVNVTGAGGAPPVPVVMIVGRPSALSNFAAYTAVGGNQTYWANPSAYTGTIIFRKIGSPIASDPVDGIEYNVGDAAGDAVCVFKNTTGATTFHDPSAFVGDTRPYYYRAYSFADVWYSTRSESMSAAATPPALWQYTAGTPLVRYLPNFLGINVPAGAFATDVTIAETEVDKTYTPPHDEELYGFRHIYGLTYIPQIPLNAGQSAVIRIPAYLDDYTAAPTRVGDISQFRVYRWPSASFDWEELTDIVDTVEYDTTAAPRGYIDVRVSALNGNDYFALAVRQTPAAGSHGCFVATAAFGTPFARQIDTLRAFRDFTLKRNAAGSAFVRFYERHSPALARFIQGKPALRSLVRLCLAPAVWLSGLCAR